ncbi:polysaccharide deacetylase family protein [Paenibacillus protaetiae]|uniref:Polysaccharide deacetylase family protein n=1 Tax=Paenibacillus protaetiae TaxID=2509456 RepID=A0A4P6FDF6_9BACL|nr:polysaccharide deacetylase family protein [Paenibacillus protaetiae]
MHRWPACFLALLLLCPLLAAGANAEAAAAKPAITAADHHAQDMSWVRLRQRYPETFVTNGSRSSKRVALTFDDAPDPRFTPQILDILKEYNVKATFFVIGYKAQKHKDLVERIHREGHVIGNHSFNHPEFTKLTAAQFQKQIGDTEQIIDETVGYKPRFIRPPYGELMSSQVRWARRHNYTIANWDVDSVDWKSSSSETILRNIRRTLRSGSIVLQHAGGGVGEDLSGTIKALPALIEELEEEGYELVTLPVLLGTEAAK